MLDKSVVLDEWNVLHVECKKQIPMISHCPGPPLTVKQSNTDKNVEIKYKNSFTPYKTLGHLKA
eukprot:8406075-Ditylum_brightwellii.AAC.1